VTEQVAASGSHTYFYELDQNYYSVTTEQTFIGQVLETLGLHSIADGAEGAAASGGYPQLSQEYIVKSDPDYVFLADTKCCKQTPQTVASRPGWSTMSAVQDDRIVPLDDDIASRWGPRIVDLMKVVATAIEEHPTA
jgi:iron complex transport system substrate-binding protein